MVEQHADESDESRIRLKSDIETIVTFQYTPWN